MIQLLQVQRGRLPLAGARLGAFPGARAQESPQPPVHGVEVAHGAQVAQHDGEDQQQHEAGVEHREAQHGQRALLADHLEEAPGARAVLHELPEAHEGQRAESEAEGAHHRRHHCAPARGEVPSIEEGVPQGKPALQGHGQQLERRGEPEEGHEEGEGLAQRAVGSRQQAPQAPVLRVGGQHEGAHEALAQEVCGRQAEHQHVEDGGRRARRARRARPQTGARQQSQGQQVAHEARAEEHPAHRRRIALLHRRGVVAAVKQRPHDRRRGEPERRLLEDRGQGGPGAEKPPGRSARVSAGEVAPPRKLRGRRGVSHGKRLLSKLSGHTPPLGAGRAAGCAADTGFAGRAGS